MGFLSGFSKVGFVENYGLSNNEKNIEVETVKSSKNQNSVWSFILWQTVYECNSEQGVIT